MSARADVATPMRPLAALRRRWLLAVLLGLEGLAAGLLVASQTATVFRAEARVVVGNGAIAQYQVPGYAAASEQLAANYARYIGSEVALGRLSSFVGTVDASVQAVTASPIPESNLIRIEVLATKRGAARETAQATAERLVATVNSQATALGSPEEILRTYTQRSADVGTAQATLQETRSGLDQAIKDGASASVVADYRTRLAAAVAALNVAELRQDTVGANYRQVQAALAPGNRLVLIADAGIVGDDAAQKRQRFALVGLALGLVLALIVAELLERRRRRRLAAEAVAAE